MLSKVDEQFHNALQQEMWLCQRVDLNKTLQFRLIRPYSYSHVATVDQHTVGWSANDWYGSIIITEHDTT